MAVIIRYDTEASDSTFAKSAKTFERRASSWGRSRTSVIRRITSTTKPGRHRVTTVVVLKDSLQLLVTGSGQIDQIGAIARYALNEYETTH